MRYTLERSYVAGDVVASDESVMTMIGGGLGGQLVRDPRAQIILNGVLATRPVPAGILERPTRGFTLPIRDWLRGDLGKHARKVLLGDRCRERGLLRTAVLERLDLHAREQRDFSDRIWSLLVLEHWCQAYLDEP